MRPLFRGLVAAAALSLAPIAVVTASTAPAHAAAVVTTKTTLSDNIRNVGEFGDFLSISGSVKSVDDPNGSSSVFAGSSFLQIKAPGSKTWRNVASDDSPSFSSYSSYDKFKTRGKFRIFYAGGTYMPGTDSERTYQPSASKAISIKVLRDIMVTSVSGKRQPTADVKVTPKFGKKKLLVQKKKGKKSYKTFRKIKTNKKGKVRFSAPGSRKGTKYRLVAKGNKQFNTTSTIVVARTF